MQHYIHKVHCKVGFPRRKTNSEPIHFPATGRTFISNISETHYRTAPYFRLFFGGFFHQFKYHLAILSFLFIRDAAYEICNARGGLLGFDLQLCRPYGAQIMCHLFLQSCRPYGAPSIIIYFSSNLITSRIGQTLSAQS